MGDAASTGNRVSITMPTPVPVSRREPEVALLVAPGHTNREIAAELAMTNRTVDTRVSNLLRKLGLASRSEVRAWAIEHGLVPSSSR